ncbi:MAG: DUF2298 domain-containing protein [Anaerolineales bacterium]|nr:DUF2298 domain-containing protein [Anaerolineales bacterium]
MDGFSSFASVFSWWLSAEILGLAALPIAAWSLRWLPERGYTFSKILGLLIASYLLWIGAMTGFIENNSGGLLFSICAVLGISIYLVIRKKLWSELFQFIQDNKRLILVVEILFSLAFLGWATLRAYAPDKIMNAGGEKFMEMAFLNGVLNSPRFPPLDPWLSGFSISYYYFGYVMMAWLTRFTGVPAGVGFELYDALLFALTLCGAFGIVYNLIMVNRLQRQKKLHPGGTFQAGAGSGRRQAAGFGLLGALMVGISGNLAGFLESIYARGLLPESFWRWLDIPGLVGNPVTGSWTPNGGFFGFGWRASRILQDYDLAGQPMAVSPITEFPFFSFLLGDNHPHVLALPFVLLAIGLAFNLLLRQAGRVAEEHEPQPGGWAFLWQDQDWALLLFTAFCIGSLGFLNTWDMPIYLGLTILAFAIGETIRSGKIDRYLIARTIVTGAGLLVAAIAFYLFFYVGFSSQAGGILPQVFRPTRLAQFLVMFGSFIAILTPYLLTVQARKRRAQTGSRWASWLTMLKIWASILAACLVVITLLLGAAILAAGQAGNQVVQNLLGVGSLEQALKQFILDRVRSPWLFLLLSGLISLALANLIPNRSHHLAESEPDPPARPWSDPSQSFVMLLVLLGLSLVLSVELFYLRDNFGVRMNTVFKFYYQAWVMLGCASAFGAWWMLKRTKGILSKVGRGVFLAGALFVLAAGMVYPLFATAARANGFRGPAALDGTSNLARANPDDWAAIAWLQSNATGADVILEAPGKSYNYEGRISAFSGIPTLLGWAYHEAQWRGNYDEQGRREPDIQTIYTTKDAGLALTLLQRWGVKYVIVGQAEMTYIQQLCSDTSRACNLTRALRKFDTALSVVFSQGNLTIYQVPTAGP